MRKNGEIVNCANCGEPKYISQWQWKFSKTGNFFCGNDCHNEYQKGERSYSYNGGGHLVNCEVCGTQKEVDSWSFNKFSFFFCSEPCKSKYYSLNLYGAAGLKGSDNINWKGGEVSVPCDWCGKVKQVGPYQLKDRKNHFCNSYCKSKWMSLNLAGKNHPNWLGGSSLEPYGLEFNNQLRLEIRERDEFTCQICGKSENELDRILSVHHINYNKRDQKKKNLISLCISCHMKTNFNRVYWQKFFQPIIAFKYFRRRNSLKLAA